MVPPVDVLEQGVFELLNGAPRAASVDEFGFDLPDGGLGQGVVVAVADGADRGQGAVALSVRQAWRTADRGRSDRSGKFGKRRGKACRGRGVEGKLVVAAAEILDEGVPGDDHLRGPIGPQAAHRS